MTLTPAYGRDYKSAEAAVKDFYAGKDFYANDLIAGSGHCSVSDFEKGSEITIRYDKLKKAVSIKVQQ